MKSMLTKHIPGRKNSGPKHRYSQASCSTLHELLQHAELIMACTVRPLRQLRRQQNSQARQPELSLRNACGWNERANSHKLSSDYHEHIKTYYMYVCVHICVCVYVYVYVCVCIRIRICMCVCIRVCICMCVYIIPRRPPLALYVSNWEYYKQVLEWQVFDKVHADTLSTVKAYWFLKWTSNELDIWLQDTFHCYQEQ